MNSWGQKRHVLAVQQRAFAEAKFSSVLRLCTGCASCVPDAHGAARCTRGKNLLPAVGLLELESGGKLVFVDSGAWTHMICIRYNEHSEQLECIARDTVSPAVIASVEQCRAIREGIYINVITQSEASNGANWTIPVQIVRRSHWKPPPRPLK